MTGISPAVRFYSASVVHGYERVAFATRLPRRVCSRRRLWLTVAEREEYFPLPGDGYAVFSLSMTLDRLRAIAVPFFRGHGSASSMLSALKPNWQGDLGVYRGKEGDGEESKF